MAKNSRMRVNFTFLRSATEIRTASFTRYYSSKNLGLVLILRVTPLAQNSLFNLLVIYFYVTFLFNDLLFFSLVFIKHSYAFFFLLDHDVRERRNVVVLFNVLKNFLKCF